MADTERGGRAGTEGFRPAFCRCGVWGALWGAVWGALWGALWGAVWGAASAASVARGVRVACAVSDMLA